MNLSPEQMKRRENVLKAFELHLQGYTYDRIGYELKCARSTAYSWVEEAQKEAIEEQQHDLNVLRNNALATINDLVSKCYEDFREASDVISDEGRLYRDGIKTRGLIVQNILKLLQERNKLFGLYAPERIEQFIVTDVEKEVETIDYNQLSLLELQDLFASTMRDRGREK